MEHPRNPDELRNALIALLALICFGLFLKLGTNDARLTYLRADTQHKLERAERARAEHARRLVVTYERAIASCLNGRGFVAGRATVLCDVTQVSR